ncbi:Alpha/Beta hydrolase protein [Sordaria brevicollis]|uniref:Carboxylic ester hydrolase n=1 Tax=Sordaria brevicollis TaxID=83679 RepID=A0AAE0PHD7_SORBR|nr:Alpha/Beta hydrolase protein [Sordaria brevicollis]
MADFGSMPILRDFGAGIANTTTFVRFTSSISPQHFYATSHCDPGIMGLACLSYVWVFSLLSSVFRAWVTPAIAATAPCVDQSALSVTVSGGVIHGIVNDTDPCVRQFLGIPFAQPPVGDLRFAPPQPAAPFGELEAKKLPPSCIQYLSTDPPSIYSQDLNEYNLEGLNVTSPNISEDCLTLSIWAPPPLTNGSLPVIIFVYGGAFSTGGQDVPVQIPTNWVERTKDHIVITFNYRLNIFGFPNARGLPLNEENLGLLDQRLAVEWVRDNIAAFGGDPSRITLWGQSAGAVSVGYWQYAYPTNPIANAFIMDSGAEITPNVHSYDVGHLTFTRIAEEVGCGNLTAQEELACMRTVPAETISQAVHAINAAATDITQLVFFLPVIDDTTVFADYTARSLAGEVAKVPTIIGSNAQDGLAFIILNQNNTVNQTQAFEATLDYFFCPAFKAATNRLLASVPVFRYEYFGNFTDVSPLPFLGAYHASELPMLFGTYDIFPETSSVRPPPDEKLEVATSEAIQDDWVAVAAAGAAGLESRGWLQYENVEEGLLRSYGVSGPAIVSREEAGEDMDVVKGTPAGLADARRIEALCPAIYQP